MSCELLHRLKLVCKGSVVLIRSFVLLCYSKINEEASLLLICGVIYLQFHN